MTKYFVRLLLFGITGCLFTFLCGCKAIGPKYQRVESIPEGKGVVYVYRPGVMTPLRDLGYSFTVWASESLIQWERRPDESSIVNLCRGGYYPFFLDAGKRKVCSHQETLTGDVTVNVTVDVEAGRSYYVKPRLTVEKVPVSGSLRRDKMKFHKLVLEDPAFAEKEIAKWGCQLIPIGIEKDSN